MTQFFTADYAWLWALGLALALFFPVRQLIWALSVKRAEQKATTDEAQRRALHRRASFTSALLCLVFAVLYTSYLFGSS